MVAAPGVVVAPPVAVAVAAATDVTLPMGTVLPLTTRSGLPLVICKPLTTPTTGVPDAVLPTIWRPISAEAAACWDAATMDVIWVSMSLIFCTIVNCAVCARNWLGSVGLTGPGTSAPRRAA